MTRKKLVILVVAVVAVVVLARLRRGPDQPEAKPTGADPAATSGALSTDTAPAGRPGDAAALAGAPPSGTRPPDEVAAPDSGPPPAVETDTARPGEDLADAPPMVDDDSARETAAGPPMDGPPPGPPSLAGEMNQLMRQITEGGGPPLTEHAGEMLASDDPLMRAVGAALYATEGPLSDEILNQLANDEDLQVPLMALGWLEDTGKTDQAVVLAGLLEAQGVTAIDLAGLIAGGELDSIAARAALDLLRNSLPAAELAPLLAETATGLDQDDVVRMKSLLLLRDTMDFEPYRDEVQRIAESTRGIDPLWDESIGRLMNSLEGPVEVQDHPPVLDPSAIDEMLAREYPAMLENLVLNVEYVLEHEDGAIAAGTSDRLRGYADEFANRPWTQNQQFSLTQLQALIEDVRVLEEATKHDVVVDRPF